MSAIQFVERNGSARPFAVRVADAVAEGSAVVILDLGVCEVDGPLLHLLVVTQKTLEARGGRLIVLCSEGPARAALYASGLDAHLTLAETLQAAIDVLAVPASNRTSHLRSP